MIIYSARSIISKVPGKRFSACANSVNSGIIRPTNRTFLELWVETKNAIDKAHNASDKLYNINCAIKLLPRLTTISTFKRLRNITSFRNSIYTNAPAMIHKIERI